MTQPKLSILAKKLSIPYAPCLLGFEGHHGNRTPTVRGIVVHQHNQILLQEAYEEYQGSLIEKQYEKKQRDIYARWKRLIFGIVTKDRLEREYGDEDDVRSGKNEVNERGDGDGIVNDEDSEADDRKYENDEKEYDKCGNAHESDDDSDNDENSETDKKCSNNIKDDNGSNDDNPKDRMARKIVKYNDDDSDNSNSVNDEDGDNDYVDANDEDSETDEYEYDDD